MQQFLLESKVDYNNPSPLRAKTKEEAIREVLDQSVNSGKRTIICREYSLVNEYEIEVDTTYKA